MHYDASTRWIKTFRAGEAGYYAPRKRGTVTVVYDSRIFVYSFGSHPDRKAAKMALQAAFRDDGKLSGQWPEYRVE